MALGAVCVVSAAAALLYLSLDYGTAVTVTVDGYTEQVRSPRRDVGELLSDLGLNLHPEDRLAPTENTPLTPGLHITVIRARQALINADGEMREVYSQARTVGEILADAGLRLDPNDEIWLEGQQQASPDTPLPASPPPGPPRFARPRPWTDREPEPVRLSVRRAVPVTVEDGSAPYTIKTTAPTVGEALLREQVTLYLGDHVIPQPRQPRPGRHAGRDSAFQSRADHVGRALDPDTYPRPDGWRCARRTRYHGGKQRQGRAAHE